MMTQKSGSCPFFSVTTFHFVAIFSIKYRHTVPVDDVVEAVDVVVENSDVVEALGAKD